MREHLERRPRIRSFRKCNRSMLQLNENISTSHETTEAVDDDDDDNDT